ncbi:MAG TPA: type II toxin-antitoxin system HicB family antitoxin [Pyrinomonadaceae bacterium]|jgi:predicted RNase H-like HicB family nuclease|nr:type II toxin-antitoxin system HicB family antitoxin [Pyrinomonadaceae bacterium]
MTKNKYSFRVFWSDEDNAYVAICPELPGVSALGDSESKALREAKVAMELYVEDMLESGEQLPEAQTAHEYSGQTRLRMSKALHRSAAEMAENLGVSLNQFINDAVAAKVGATQFGAEMINEMKKIIRQHEDQNRVAMASMFVSSAGRMIEEITTVRIERKTADSNPLPPGYGVTPSRRNNS